MTEFEAYGASEVLLVANDDAAGSDGAAAATAAGLRIRRATPDSALAAIDVRPGAVLIESEGWNDAAIAGLPPLVAATAAAGVPTVVAFAVDQLDTVGAMLVGGDAVLLCAPDLSDRAGALVVATLGAGGAVRDSSAEAERLRRLNEEVARFAATLARLTAASEADAPAGSTFAAEPVVPADAMAGTVDPAEIRRAIRSRRMRDDLFGQAGLFEDPGWDMLLDLFAAELERRVVSVSSLCIAAAVAPTTALRWIAKLIDTGLVDRRPDEHDRRRAFVALTARASTGLRHYVLAVRRAGLPIA